MAVSLWHSHRETLPGSFDEANDNQFAPQVCL